MKPSTPVRLSVSVPATSANLGPGFDCMGLALELRNTFTLELGPHLTGIEVEVRGEGEGVLPTDASHVTVEVFREEVRRRGLEPPALRLRCDNEVPCASGLGSSSTAVLAGVIFAEAARMGAGTDPDFAVHRVELRNVLARAVDLEGHGDNVAPALLGGLQVVFTEGEDYRCRPIPIAPFRVTAVVPRYDYLTVEARAALPKTISHKDAVFNIGHAILVSEAFRNHDTALLAAAMQDRMHEPYRLGSIPGAEAARACALESGATAVALSGAGPGLLAFAEGDYDAIGRAMVGAFGQAGLQARHWVLSASNGGAILRVLEPAT